MKKILVSALCILLAITFIVTLYFHGTGKRFSLKKWIMRFAILFEKLELFGNVSQYWVYESFSVGGETIYPEDMPDTSVDWFVGGIMDFFGTVNGFFVRVFYSVRHMALVFYVVQTTAYGLLPWNCYVEVPS